MESLRISDRGGPCENNGNATRRSRPRRTSQRARQPSGSIRTPEPALVPVLTCIVSSLGCGRRGSGAAVRIDSGSFACAYHGRDRHWSLRIGFTGRGSPGVVTAAAGRSCSSPSAVGVDQGTLAGADGTVDRHASLPFVRGGAAPRLSLRRAVRVDDAAVAGADRGVGGHRHSPFNRGPGRRGGRRRGLRRRGSKSGCSSSSLLQCGGPPCGSRPLPSPARMVVWVIVVALRSAGAGAAVGADPGAFGRADVGGRVHRRLSFSRGRSRRGDRCRCLRRPGRWWWCASPCSGQSWPWGHIPGPSAARTRVVVCMELRRGKSVGVAAEAGRRFRRERGSRPVSTDSTRREARECRMWDGGCCGGTDGARPRRTVRAGGGHP
jgi:hypothetical protein